MSPAKEYLTTTEAETYTGLRDMAERRVRGTGPAFIKTGSGRTARVLYKKSEIDNWLRQRTRQRTSDPAPAAAQVRADKAEQEAIHIGWLKAK